MNHLHIVEKRNAEKEKNLYAKLQKMEEENAKHKEKVYSNRDAVYILLKTAQEEGTWSWKLAYPTSAILKFEPWIYLVN